MCLSCRHTLFALAATALLSTVVQAEDDDAYTKQLKEYDRRVAEQQRAVDQQNTARWLVPVIAITVGVAIVIYSQHGAKRRVAALASQSRAAVAEASEQNKRIIELLESIDRNTRGPGT